MLRIVTPLPTSPTFKCQLTAMVVLIILSVSLQLRQNQSEPSYLYFGGPLTATDSPSQAALGFSVSEFQLVGRWEVNFHYCSNLNISSFLFLFLCFHKNFFVLFYRSYFPITCWTSVPITDRCRRRWNQLPLLLCCSQAADLAIARRRLDHQIIRDITTASRSLTTTASSVAC